MECVDENPIFLSPVAVFANRLLNGDISKDKEERLSGLLVRTTDYFGLENNLTEVLIRHSMSPINPAPPLKYLPSSYLHGSLRAPGAIYQNIVDKEFNQGDFSLIFGTKFGKNTALKEFQKDNKSIDCEFIYIHDGATVDRGTVFDKTMCNDIAKDNGICVDDECLAHGPGACNGCKTDPDNFGDLVGRWAEANHKLTEFYYQSCFYDTTEDAVVASNSLWSHRRRWFLDVDVPIDYQGYTECATSLNIAEPGMADAVVLTLHRTAENTTPQSVCHFPNHVWLEDRLKVAYEQGHGDLPVLFYRESNGVHRISDCVRLLGARDCDDAWQKEFFSQEYDFSGACLHKPPGCSEVYYFPADPSREETCSAFTDMGKERIDRLCREEKSQDARTAYEKLMNPKTRTSTKAESKDSQTPSSHTKAHISPDIQLLAAESFSGRPFDTTNSKTRVIVGASLAQNPSSTDWGLHALFFLSGLIISLFFRKKLSFSFSRES